MERSLESIKPEIVKVLKKGGVKKAGVFGSYARGEARKRSDVDILVEFRGRKSLFDLAGLELQLEGQLKRKVDLITYNSLHPLLRERILNEEIRII